MGWISKALVSATAALWLSGCGPADPPEVQVRAVIDAAEVAAEARSVSAMMDLISPDYRDAQGRQPEDLSRYLRGYFIANQSIRLLTRIERLEFPAADVAEVDLMVAMVGREAEAQSAWNLAADLFRFELTLMNDGGDWRVTHAEADRIGR